LVVGKIITEFGFRVDPVKWVEDDQSLRGAVVRERVFKIGSSDDRRKIDGQIDRTLSRKKADGTLDRPRSSEPFKDKIAFGYPGDEWNTEILLELLEMGLPGNSSEVQDTLDKLCDLALQKDNRMSAYMLIAAGLSGWEKGDEPASSLVKYAEEWMEWNGRGYCPWGPSLILKALCLGRRNAGVEKGVTHVLETIHHGMNQAGIFNYRDPWAILDAAGRIGHELADKIVEKLIPLVLRSQLADGSWGVYSYQVHKALENKGLTDTLQSKPPLPEDFIVTRSIPAPEGNLATMAWGSNKLWLFDRSSGETITVSPDDGRAVRRLRIPLRDIQGIAWVDGNLAVAQKEKKFALADPETGEVIEQQDIFRADWLGWVGGLEKVGDEIWVTDVFNCVVVSYPLKGALLGKEKFRGLGGPAPVGMAAVDGTVWHYDWLTPRIIYRGDTEGRLLDWCSIPVDFKEVEGSHCSGLAFDGKHLWALDGGNRRICIIERSPKPCQCEEGYAAS